MDIKDFIQRYYKGTIQITSSVSYDCRDLLEENIRLWHGQFVDSYFADGKTKKLFYNILYVLCDVIFRNTDIDPKDVSIRSTNGKAIDLVSILEMAVQSWMKRNFFGEDLDDIRRDLIPYGHIIRKVVDGKAYEVNPLNIIVPPHVKSIQDSGCVEEIHWTWDQMQEHKDEFAEHWEEIVKIWEKIKKDQQPYFVIYEHWKMDDFPDGKDGEGNDLMKLQKGCIQYLGRDVLKEDEAKSPEEWSPYLELRRFKSPNKVKIASKRRRKKLGTDYELVYPYEDKQLIKLKGRYWGLGFVELCKAIAEDYNETMNLGRKYRKLILRGILVHYKAADDDNPTQLSQQFLANVDTGAAISLKQGERLERLNLGTVTLEVIQYVDKLFELARQMTGTTAQETMANTPSGMPATVGILNSQQAKTTYQVVNEVQAQFLNRLFSNFLLNEVIEDLDAEEVTAITGDPMELKELDRKLAENALYSELHANKKKHGYFSLERDGQLIPIVEQVQIDEELAIVLAELEKKGDTRFPELKKAMLKDIEYTLEFLISNEYFDKQNQIFNIEKLLANPNLTLSRQKLEQEYLDLNGFSGKRYEKTPEEKAAELEAQKMEMMAEQGGMMDTSLGTLGQQFINSNA